MAQQGVTPMQQHLRILLVVLTVALPVAASSTWLTNGNDSATGWGVGDLLHNHDGKGGSVGQVLAVLLPLVVCLLVIAVLFPPWSIEPWYAKVLGAGALLLAAGLAVALFLAWHYEDLKAGSGLYCGLLASLFVGSLWLQSASDRWPSPATVDELVS
jgi:hypothetical protein